VKFGSSAVSWAAVALGVFFAVRGMGSALWRDDVIQDDARQHVFWMLRWADPTLFAADPIAEYFSAVAPFGFKALYWMITLVVDPIAATKLLPLLLSAALGLGVFQLARTCGASTCGALLAVALTLAYAWQHDDIDSATPRAFLLPLVAWAAWATASGRQFLAVGLGVLGTAIYPAIGLLVIGTVCAGAVRIAVTSRAIDRRASLVCVLGAALVVVVALIVQLPAREFGPAVTAHEARAMQEFGPGGRNAFFGGTPFEYWIASFRSGFNLRVVDPWSRTVPLLGWLVLAALPFAVSLARSTARPRTATLVLLDLAVASVALFAIAHATLFALYLPARFVQWTVPLAIGVAAALGLDQQTGERLRHATVALTIALAVVPLQTDGYLVADPHPNITAYLLDQSPDVLVAGASTHLDSVPSFAARPILMSREYALAYHLGYYTVARQRMHDLVESYYADSPRGALEPIRKYGVGFMLVDGAAFDRDRAIDAWSGGFQPFTATIVDHVRRRGRWAWPEFARTCGVAQDGEVVLVSVACAAARAA
jgi:hypothetical protein